MGQTKAGPRKERCPPSPRLRLGGPPQMRAGARKGGTKNTARALLSFHACGEIPISAGGSLTNCRDGGTRGMWA